jgi:hypothetical protein
MDVLFSCWQISPSIIRSSHKDDHREDSHA